MEDPFDCYFRPYSSGKGNLEDYLREHDGTSSEPLFHGIEYFETIKENGWLIPGITQIRINESPAPDILYGISTNFLLESFGEGKSNMSCVSASAGTYNPEEVLRDKNWSILGLDLDKNFHKVS